MLNKDYLLSFILHFVIIGSTLISSPFEHSRKMEFGEVIKVSLKTLPEIQKEEPVSLPPPVIPKPVLTEDIVEIPVDDPKTIKEKKEVKKEEKPKEDKKPKLPEQTEAAPPTAETDANEKEIESESTASGQMFAGATVHNEAFDYPYWFDQAFNKISANFRNPVSSDASIVAVVYFEVIQSGRVVQLQISESSGIQPFDDACLRSIQRSEPFPPLPRSFHEEIIGITLPFKFEPH